MGELINLRRLSLGGNELSGRIPLELGNLASVEELSLDRTFLTGELPRSLLQLSALTRFTIDETAICVPDDPTVKEWLATISDFRTSGLTCDGSLSVAFGASSYVRRRG